jgi:hypothetical protein
MIIARSHSEHPEHETNIQNIVILISCDFIESM